MDIEEADMRVIVRLLGETAALPGGLMKKKVHVLDGLCDLAGSMEWIWMLSYSASQTRFLRRKLAENLPLQLDLPEADSPTKLLETLPPSHVIASLRTLDSTTESKILLLRNPSESGYSRREIHLTNLVLDEIPWLHWSEWPNPQPLLDSLPPRQRLTMDLLLLGLGRKAIATQMRISEGTVSGYMRELYQQYGVNSQAELMRIQLQKPPS